MTPLALVALVCVLSVTAATWAHVRVRRAVQDAADMAWADETCAWLREVAR